MYNSLICHMIYMIFPTFQLADDMLLPQVMQDLEKSDLGCGAGGGRNNVDVFRMAGLTFLTNANADDSNEAGIFLSFKHETVDFLS